MKRCAAFLFLALLAPLAFAQDSITVTSDPRDLARPVSALLNQLRKRERISVTYEDPRYAKRDDMGRKAVSFTYSAEELHGPEGPEIVVARMLREHGASGGLTFTVVREGSRLHVLPSESLDEAGRRIRQDSIMDTRITIPAARRDGGELLQAICDEIKKQTGYEIGVGPSAPGNNLARYISLEGVDNKTARAALEDLLDRACPPGSFVWDLYFDPADGGYGLNFNYIGLAGPVDKHKQP